MLQIFNIGGMPLAQLQLGLATWEGGGKSFKPVVEKGKDPLAPQFPLAEPASGNFV